MNFNHSMSDDNGCSF